MIRQITEKPPKIGRYGWHPWFAWRPVTAQGVGRLADLKYRVWLEKIHRRFTACKDGDSVEYAITGADMLRINKKMRERQERDATYKPLV